MNINCYLLIANKFKRMENRILKTIRDSIMLSQLIGCHSYESKNKNRKVLHAFDEHSWILENTKIVWKVRNSFQIYGFVFVELGHYPQKKTVRPKNACHVLLYGRTKIINQFYFNNIFAIFSTRVVEKLNVVFWSSIMT